MEIRYGRLLQKVRVCMNSLYLLNIGVWKEYQTGLCWLLPLVNLETISKEVPVV